MACSSISNFTTSPNGGSVDVSDIFAPGAAGSGSSTRRYRIVGYNNGSGYNYGSGPVNSDGTLSAEGFVGEGSGASFNPNNLSFTSDYDYPEYMSVIVSEPEEDCPPDPPCNCPEPEYSEPETCADEICVGESKVVMRTLLNSGDFDECCEQPLPEVAQTINGTFSPLITVNFTSGVAGETIARGEMCVNTAGCPEATIECFPVSTGAANGGGLEDGIYTTTTQTGKPRKPSLGPWATTSQFGGLPGSRHSILIHPDITDNGTAGCIGITGGPDNWAAAKAALDKVFKSGKCGSSVEISVTTAPGVTRKVGRTINDTPVESEQSVVGSSGTNL